MHLSTEESPASWMVKLFVKLAEVFLNTFHRRSFSINVVVKSYREFTVLSTLQLDFFSYLNMQHLGAGHIFYAPKGTLGGI